MLRCVKKARRGIATSRLPACDRRAGLVIELSVDLGVEADTGQPTLHVATLAPVQTDLIFGFLGCFVGNGTPIDSELWNTLIGMLSTKKLKHTKLQISIPKFSNRNETEVLR